MTDNVITFEAFPKIPRLKRDCVVTEKIDGTNAQIIITEHGEIGAASRTRLITPGKDTDNFGFAGWVEDNKDELLKLGPGRHFGEWYGLGIQRGYGLDEKRFALFNTGRWNDNPDRPECCDVVPVLYAGQFTDWDIEVALANLAVGGSKMVPGFPEPEGIVVFHTASRTMFKRTLEGDEAPKGMAA